MTEASDFLPEKTTPRGTRRRSVTMGSDAEAAAGVFAGAVAAEVSGEGAVAAAAVAAVAAAEGVVAADGVAAPAADGEVKPAPKRRGRPPKVRTEDAASEAKAEPSADAPDNAAADGATGDKPAKRRGRPAKRNHDAKDEARAATVADGAPAEASAEADAAPEAKPASAASAPAQPQQRPNNQGQNFQSRDQNGRADRQDRQDRNNRNDRNNRSRQQNQRTPRDLAPSLTIEDLEHEDIEELFARAGLLDVQTDGLERDDLIRAIVTAQARLEGFVEVQGILDVLTDGYGFLRTSGYLPGENDVYVATPTIRRNGLRRGDLVAGVTRPARENEKYAALQKVTAVNGTPLEQLGVRVKFADLTPVYPDERLIMEHGKQAMTARVIDLVAPIGKGQRGLIVSPPKAGKTTILKDIAASISANNPEVHLMCLLVDERPEEVTDMQRSIHGEVISSTFDMPCENHIAVAELVIERAKRLVECGRDVVILLDSITRLARAYNLAQPASGRILSGGVDSTALYPPKRFLGAARNIEGGGSLTILASALIDTGSKMDEVIFEEFKGTGNMELKLDRNLADRRIFPAIDPVSSGTRKEELLMNPQEAPLIWAVRRILANLNNTERAMDMLIKSLKATDNNVEFLIRTAKKAQLHKGDEAIEL